MAAITTTRTIPEKKPVSFSNLLRELLDYARARAR